MSVIKLLPIVESIIVRDMFEGFDEEEITEDYPLAFNWNEFKKLTRHQKRIEYAKEHLGKPIGRGSARLVFKVDDTKVLKLALNKKGVAQNRSESDWFETSYYEEILAKVIDYDPENNLWVEMEMAYKPNELDFRRLLGVDLTVLGTYLSNRYNEENGRSIRYNLSKETKSEYDNNQVVQLLVSFMFDSDIVPGDLEKITSWGMVKRDGEKYLVIIDFGLTSSVYKSYYS